MLVGLTAGMQANRQSDEILVDLKYLIGRIFMVFNKSTVLL